MIEVWLWNGILLDLFKDVDILSNVKYKTFVFYFYSNCIKDAQ